MKRRHIKNCLYYLEADLKRALMKAYRLKIIRAPAQPMNAL